MSDQAHHVADKDDEIISRANSRLKSVKKLATRCMPNASNIVAPVLSSDDLTMDIITKSISEALNVENPNAEDLISVNNHNETIIGSSCYVTP